MIAPPTLLKHSWQASRQRIAALQGKVGSSTSGPVVPPIPGLLPIDCFLFPHNRSMQEHLALQLKWENSLQETRSRVWVHMVLHVRVHKRHSMTATGGTKHVRKPNCLDLCTLFTLKYLSRNPHHCLRSQSMNPSLRSLSMNPSLRSLSMSGSLTSLSMSGSLRRL